MGNRDKRPRAPRARAQAAALWVPRESLKPWRQNALERDNEHVVPRIAASIVEFGWGRTLVARVANRELCIGHASWEASALLAKLWEEATPKARKAWHPDARRTLRRGEVPCRFVKLTPAQAHKLARADNRLAELARWRPEALAGALQGYGADDRELMGWTENAFEKLLREAGAAAPVSPATEDRDAADDEPPERFQLIVECTERAQLKEIRSWARRKGFGVHKVA